MSYEGYVQSRISSRNLYRGDLYEFLQKARIWGRELYKTLVFSYKVVWGYFPDHILSRISYGGPPESRIPS